MHNWFYQKRALSDAGNVPAHVEAQTKEKGSFAESQQQRT
jgi:hypothetical protein